MVRQYRQPARRRGSKLRQSDVRSSPSASATWYPFRIVQAAGDHYGSCNPRLSGICRHTRPNERSKRPRATIGAGTVGRAESRRESSFFDRRSGESFVWPLRRVPLGPRFTATAPRTDARRRACSAPYALDRGARGNPAWCADRCPCRVRTATSKHRRAGTVELRRTDRPSKISFLVHHVD
jgi:hypothetical protein